MSKLSVGRLCTVKRVVFPAERAQDMRCVAGCGCGCPAVQVIPETQVRHARTGQLRLRLRQRLTRHRPIDGTDPPRNTSPSRPSLPEPPSLRADAKEPRKVETQAPSAQESLDASDFRSDFLVVYEPSRYSFFWRLPNAISLAAYYRSFDIVKKLFCIACLCFLK